MSKNHKMRDKTLNSMKKAEAWSPFRHYTIYASVKFGIHSFFIHFSTLETPLSCVERDKDDQIWRIWFHGL